MGLLEQEIKELRQMNTKLMAGEIKLDEVYARIAVYSQTEKRAKMILQAYTMGAKYGKNQINNLTKTQLIGDETVIDLNTEIEKELIACPDQDRTITRLECRRFSETTGNLTKCQSCPNFRTTRRLLDSI